jgi:isopenicillin N synthase-like dioxygenase
MKDRTGYLPQVMAPTPNFPVVSFAPFLNGSIAEQREVAQQLYDAFSVYGWIYLKDFGFTQQEIDQLFATVCLHPTHLRSFLF